LNEPEILSPLDILNPLNLISNLGSLFLSTIGSSDNELTKHLTISSSPTEGFLEVTKRLTGHPFANALASLNERDKVKLRGPFGKFTFHGEYKRIGMLSGGIGILRFEAL